MFDGNLKRGDPNIDPRNTIIMLVLKTPQKVPLVLGNSHIRLQAWGMLNKQPKPSVQPPTLSNSWIIIVIWLYVALNRTPNIDCY